MTDREGPGLYVHVPFCVRKCPYCAFYSVSDRSLVGAWLVALGREAERVQARGFWTRAGGRAPALAPFDSLYVGGGSPSVLTAGEIERLFTIIRRHFVVSPAAEVTVEANPADVTADGCRVLAALGVGRLSLGVQSLDTRVLGWLGRRHDEATALRALEIARASPVASLSVDLIYGVPGERRAGLLRTVERVTAYAPEHLSCYMLTVEPGTPLAQAVHGGQQRAPSEALLARRFLETSEWLGGRGYAHDEVSSFSRAPEHRARHNGKYWRHVPYLGLGPAAHSFTGAARHWNVTDVAEYVERLTCARSPVEGGEQLGPAELRLEALALGLRTSEGVSAELVTGREARVTALVERGWLRDTGSRLVPTRHGMLFADRMAVELG